MNFRKKLAAIAVASLIAPTAWATNGYMPHGIGTTSKAMAGAGSALPQDTLSVFNNPAGLVRLGTRLDAEMDFFMPNREYKANKIPGAPPGSEPIPKGTESSDNDIFFIPGFGYSHALDEKSSLGIALIGNGGMNTEYDTATFKNFGRPGTPFEASEPTGIDFAQLLLGFTYSRQLTPNHAIGITPMVAAQRIKARGLQPFKMFSASPGNLTNNGYEYSYGGGVRAGWLGSLHKRLDVGVSYQSKLWMSDFDDYEGLFADGGEFDIPPILNVGVSVKLTPQLTLLGDYKRIYYGDIDALNNDNNVSMADLQSGKHLLGSDDGMGFGWDDVDVFSVALQYQYNSKLTVRTGYSHGDEPWDNDNTLFNILAPATIQNHLSAGLTYRFNDQSALNVAYTHAFKNTIQGTSTLTGPQTGHVRMHQNDLQIGYSHQF
jgi:long-chain fatty acid transport protein